MFTYTPHQLVVDPYTKYTEIRHAHDSVCLIAEGQQYHIQHGQVYDGGIGAPIPLDDLPTWFWDRVRALTPEARRSCGFVLPEEEVHTAADLPADLVAQISALPEHIRAELLQGSSRMPEKAPKTSDEGSDPSVPSDGLKNDPRASQPKMWTCESCGLEIPLAKKGVHLARLARLKRCA